MYISRFDINSQANLWCKKIKRAVVRINWNIAKKSELLLLRLAWFCRLVCVFATSYMTHVTETFTTIIEELIQIPKYFMKHTNIYSLIKKSFFSLSFKQMSVPAAHVQSLTRCRQIFCFKVGKSEVWVFPYSCWWFVAFLVWIYLFSLHMAQSVHCHFLLLLLLLFFRLTGREKIVGPAEVLIKLKGCNVSVFV